MRSTPTRKWLAARGIAAGALATSIIVTGFGDANQIMLVGVIVEAWTSYLVPNDPNNPAS